MFITGDLLLHPILVEVQLLHETPELLHAKESQGFATPYFLELTPSLSRCTVLARNFHHSIGEPGDYPIHVASVEI